MTGRAIVRAAAGWAGSLLLLLALAPGAGAETLTLDRPEMAGISGFRAFWDRPVVVRGDGATVLSDQGPYGGGRVADWTTDRPGAPVFDAVHRSLLVRFPDAAERLAAELRRGRSLRRLDLVIPFVDTELYPLGYALPAGLSFLGDQWVRLPPRWHAVAWALRRPWLADPRLGPTFNAYVNGAGYWGRFGAEDPGRDRYPHRFGPVEVSATAPEARMDVTVVLSDPAFGGTPGERLRGLADHGFLLRKWETYDARYAQGGYEWGTATGGRGLLVKPPRLVATFDTAAPPGGATTPRGAMPPPGPATLDPVPAAADVRRLADQLRREPSRAGSPTAAMPEPSQVEAWIRRFGFRRPLGMAEWQWTRLAELHGLGGGTRFPESLEAYGRWLDDQLARPYRYWEGWSVSDRIAEAVRYQDAVPEIVREHWRRGWAAWLLPGRPYWQLEHPQWTIWSTPAESYYARTGDWRGNTSFFREGYTRYISTMNFNHTAAMGALLGGALIGDVEAMRDGRHGLEHFPLRLWAWYDGTTQESIDHYYLGLTLSAQKLFADLGPTPVDRLMGRSALAKSVEELVSAYHPGLRHFVATSGRTGAAYLLAINEGVQHIVHTLSRAGALHDVDNPERHGMPVVGDDLPPGRVAALARESPWAPDWMANLVDGKPLPYEMTVAYRAWGRHRDRPLWKRSYLGRHYGLATLDVSTGAETVPILAQWQRAPRPVTRVQELGTLLLRYGVNRTNFLDTLFHGTAASNPDGSLGPPVGSTVALQSRGKAIVLASPARRLGAADATPGPGPLRSLQASVALLDLQPAPTWQVYVDDTRVVTLPFRARAGARIAVHDGVTFVGLIPLPATNLGRTEEVLIDGGGPPVPLQGGGRLAPALVIDNYNYSDRDRPFDRAGPAGALADRAFSGFVLEVADDTEFADFAAFRRHLGAATLALAWDDPTQTLDVTYRSGPDTLELGYRPAEAAAADASTPADRIVSYRRVNGVWPYLPTGLDRDTTLSQQGTTGRLEKQGAVLTFPPGRTGYLVAEPVGGTYTFYNPLPDPQAMTLSVPGGIQIAADGKLGLARVSVAPATGHLSVDYAVTDGQTGDDMASALLVSGLSRAPAVTRNGSLLADTGVRALTLDGRRTYVVPLLEGTPPRSGPEIARRRAEAARAGASVGPASRKGAAVLRCEAGHEPYLLAEPTSGAYEFQRLWPDPTVFSAEAPGGVTVAADGRLGLLRLLVSPREGRVEVDYPPYAQRRIEGRAAALLIAGMPGTPAVFLHGQRYTGRVEAVTLDGRAAALIPLFGEDPAVLARDVATRYRAVQALLPAPDP